MQPPALAFTLLILLLAPVSMAETAKATFAGGCFWCMEQAFNGLPGVVDTRVGFIGGHAPDPTYYQVAQGRTGHLEAVEVTFDDEQISYPRLLQRFWRNIDPLDGGGQFCDRGAQYRTAVFYHTARQRQQAEQSKRELAVSHRLEGPIKTQIQPAGHFTVADDYHQQYAQKNPIRYRFYRYSCGRDQRLEELWGDS